ncbi:MAG: MBL fold metallo-hydrolase [Desulfuromonadales bacterium]|nr:MBL fold metallo-hydrolase [Desulfuromonadales bacterium]
MAIEIVQIAVPGTDNFSYLVVCPATGQALAVDPGRDPQPLLDTIRQRRLTVSILANSHGHQDHIAGNAEVLAATGAQLAAHPADVAEADIALSEGSCLTVGELAVRVLHTPGHTAGSVCFLLPQAVLTGDTLFVTRCGRADLPGSDPHALYHSLLRLAALPPETSVYPGHDYGPRPHSTIAFERQHNPYLQCPDLSAFLKLRMG